MGAVDATEWACVLCGCHIHNDWVEQWICTKFFSKLEHFLHRNYLDHSEGHSLGQLLIGSFITTMHLLMHHVLFSFLAKHRITRVTQPPTAKIWHPVTAGFYQNWNQLWKGRDFRPSMRFRKIQWGNWWWLGELCEVPKFLLWRGLRHIVLCTVFLVSCIFFNKCLYFS